MMRVLQINSVYRKGSTGKIVHDLHRKLEEKGADSFVIYGRGISSETDIQDSHVIRICSDFYAKVNTARAMVTGLPYGGCEISTCRLIWQIQRLKPDVVHLQCINEHFVNIYRLLEWLGRNKIPTVVTLHAEFMFTANCGHANDCERWKKGCGRCPRRKEATRSLWLDRTWSSFRKMEKAYSAFGQSICIVSVSPWLMSRAVKAPLLRGINQRVIMNGLDTMVFHPRTRYSHIPEKVCTPDTRVVFHATAMFRDKKEDPKGGWYIVRLAEMLREAGVVFLVAGKYEISGRLPDNLVLLGPVQDQDAMAEYYSRADVTVIASRRETFSMVCAESLCCGTPVAGFEAGGPESIAIPEYSAFARYGDVEALLGCVKKLITVKRNEYIYGNIAEQAAKLYDTEIMADQYLKIYRQLTGEK